MAQRGPWQWKRKRKTRLECRVPKTDKNFPPFSHTKRSDPTASVLFLPLSLSLSCFFSLLFLRVRYIYSHRRLSLSRYLMLSRFPPNSINLIHFISIKSFGVVPSYSFRSCLVDSAPRSSIPMAMPPKSSMPSVGTELGLASRFWDKFRRESIFAMYTPFAVCLASGNLKIESFRHYIAQDFHFLRAFAQAWVSISFFSLFSSFSLSLI